MAWFSRPKSPAVPAQPEVQPFDAGTDRGASEQGRYGPKVRIIRFDDAPEELSWQVPVRGELFRLMPGPDRPDYSVMLLEHPLRFYPVEGFDLARIGTDRLVEDRQGRRMVAVHALVLTARYVGQQLHPGMVDLPVNVAYVLDHSLVEDSAVDLAKIEFAGVGFLTEGMDEPRPASPATPPVPPDRLEPEAVVDSVGREIAAILREGVAQRRGASVERLTATVTIDQNRRISGLTGNADGSAPEPTPETFERINAALARLSNLPPERTISSLTVHATGDDVTVDQVPGTP